MSLELSRSEKNIWVKTDSGSPLVRMTFDNGKLAIDLEDFCEMALYVLTNTDLMHDDPRLVLMRRLAELNVVPGYNDGGKRLAGHEL